MFIERRCHQHRILQHVRGGEAEVGGGPRGWAEAEQTSSSNSAVKGNQVNCEERRQQRSCFLIEVNVFNYG